MLGAYTGSRHLDISLQAIRAPVRILSRSNVCSGPVTLAGAGEEGNRVGRQLEDHWQQSGQDNDTRQESQLHPVNAGINKSIVTPPFLTRGISCRG